MTLLDTQLYLYSVGDGLTFATLFAKMFRVWRIFNPSKTTLSKVRVGIMDVLPIIGFFVLIRVLVLLVSELEGTTRHARALPSTTHAWLDVPLHPGVAAGRPSHLGP